MDRARDIVRRFAAARGHTKVATFPPFSKNGPPPPPGGSATKRNIPEAHPFDAKALKPMAKALWAASVSLGHALTAYRHLSRLKSTTISPDGMLGGRGYIMPVKDARQRLFDACEALSAITDTLHDEIQAPHWKPKLAQLDANDAEDIERFVEESQGILANPEDEAEEEIEEIEKTNDDGDVGGEKEGDDDTEAEASRLPNGGPIEESEAKKPSVKEASLRGRTRYWTAFDDASFWSKMADSSVDPDTLPGPRVDSLDRGEQTGPWGSFNEDEEPSDNWFDHGETEYMYPHEGDNDLREASDDLWAESAVPDSTTEDTPTDGWDFGLGYGAKGEGAGGYANPSDEGNGKGVWGPHSGLPGSPSLAVGDTTPTVDVRLNERHALLNSLLPGDNEEPVARSDYFSGPKGNLVQSESGLPEAVSPKGDNALSLMDTAYVQEDLATPYVRYDYTTQTYRNDPIENWPQGEGE